jgi:THO complex subunit 2
MTDEIVAKWQDSGRQAVQDLAKGGDYLIASAVVQELVRAGLDGKVDATEVGATVKDIIAQQEEGSDIESLFLDTISLLDDADAKNSALTRLVNATAINPDTMRQELDVPLLTSLGLVRSTFERMRARKTTNQLYRQANFNLLREETEGYAKLLTDYYNAATESAHSDDAEMAKDACHRIMALVGAFDLDVGRVLDITLDISASLLVKSFRFFVKFYRRSSWWPQKVVLDDIKFEDQEFGALPSWALPDSGKWATSDQDRAELAQLRLTRDLAFWERVRDVGMDAFFELGARKIVDFDSALPLLETEVQAQYDARGNEINADQRKRINETRKYMRETRTLPPPGNPDAAQLLGFKLRFYASPARDANDVLPENLIYLAALLIKIGFVSMRDLYPHLYPLDEDMPAEKERLEKEKAEKERKERPGGGMNALLAAGALADDTVPSVRGLRGDAGRSGGSSPKPDKKEEEAKEQLPSPTNQKLLLLKALLAIGALPDALFILGKFPWLAEVDGSITPYLLRIVRKMLSKVAEDTQPMSDRTELQDTKQQLANSTPASDGSLLLSSRSKTRTRRWLGLDEPDDGEGVSHLHYYQDWDDNIPICQSVEDVFLLCSTFLGYLGVKIGQDTLVITTLLRLAKRSLGDDTSDSNRARWLDLMKRLLVPALSLTKHNPAVAQEVWELLKFFPIPIRYNIYAEWFTGKTSRTPDMKVALDRNRAEAKDVLRRITNEGGKKQARSLAKVSFASPGVVVMAFINQLESYSNMIPGLVESVRYFSLLSFDVLAWCLINALSGQGRNRMQSDGMLTSPWLQALSLFVASLFTRYPTINPSPILQYVAYELRSGDSTDLQLIDSVLAEMAGVRSEMNFNETQVLGMTGGELLQSQIVQQLFDLRHTKKTSAKRLIKALSEPGLVGQILISIAQERQMYPHRDASKDMPLKVLGSNLDMIQQIFAQYLDVLRTNLSPPDFEAAVPDVISLIGDFGLEPGTAFAICRVGILYRMAEVDAARKEQKLGRKEDERRKSQSLGDTSMKEAAAVGKETQAETEASASHDGNATPALKVEDTAMPETTTSDNDSHMKDAGDVNSHKEDPTSTPAPQQSASATESDEVSPWHPTLEPIMNKLSEINPGLASRVSIPFYVTFWTLAPQDVIVPMEVYQSEMEKLQAQAKQIGGDRTDMSANGLKERDRKRKTVIDIADKLRAEMNERITGFRGYSQVKMWLNTQKKHWFSLLTRKLDKETRHIDLLQDCFLPRAMMSALDAHYCLQIIKVMHNNATPGFSTGGLLAEIFNRERLSGVLSQCTAREAENLGRFLYEILKLVAHWHSKEDIYKKEALGSQGQLHGFAVTYKKDTGAPETHQDYEQFRRFVSNWHSALTWALKACLNSGEYMQIRNSIIVLRTIVPVYPALVHQGNQLTEIVKALSERESRNDLKLAALSLRGPLKNREKTWVQPQAFRLNQNSNTGNSRTSSARPETPQPGAGVPKLNAGAQEFQPTGPRPFDVQSGKTGAAEDGEIEDEKPTSTKQDVKMNDAPEVKPSHQAKSDPPRNAGRNARKDESKPSTPGPAGNPNQLPILNGSRRNDVSSQPPSRPVSSAPQVPGNGLPPKPLPSASGPRSNRGGRDDDQHGRLDRPSEPRVSRERSPGHRSRARTPERDPREQYGPPRAYRDDQRQGPRVAPADSRYTRDEARNKPPREPLGPQQMPGSQPTRDEPRNAPKREPLGPQQMPTSHGSRDEPRSASRREPLGPQQMPGPHSASDNRSRNMGPPVQSPHPERLPHLQANNVLQTQHHDSRSSPSVSHGAQGASANIEPVINPARAALISDLPKGDTSRRRDRDARHDERTPAPAVGPDNRVNGRQDSTREMASRVEQDTPTGPRASRAGGRDLTNEPRGRPNRENGPSEPTYGRLNAPANAPSPDTPSGPRGPGATAGRGGRNFTAPGSTMNARSDSMASSPAVARAPLNEPAQFADRHNPSQPSTPAADSGPIHPSRMPKFAPPPINTNNASSGGPRNPSSPTGPPPSGPRSDRLPAGTPTGPSPVVGPPSGPAGPERKRGDRQRANINATLQGAGNGPGANGSVQFRGAARSTSFTAPSPSAAPAAPPVEPAARREGMSGTPDSRADLFAPRTGDDREARSRRYEERAEPRQRGSRHPSRERRGDDEPSRRPPPQALDEGRDNARGDDRRSRDDRSGRDGGHRRGTREQEQGRRPLPDAPGSFHGGPSQVPPPPPPPGPPPGNPPDWERGPSRHDAPSFDNRRGGRGGEFRAGGGGGRREDDRSGGRGPGRQEDLMQPQGGDGRKRRHEDGGHGPGGFEAKRRRSAR